MDKRFLEDKIISRDGPNSDEVRHDESLSEWCATRIEPEEESNRRRNVLERLNNVMRMWIRHTMIAEFNMPEAAANQVEGRLFATGSYRYNVHTSGSDIDIVLIAPNRITRTHFFESLATRLKSEPWVKDLHCIQDSRVPIIAMVCDGIDIDLSFGSIRQDRVPEVITDDLLQGLDDETSVLSCNAVRVAHNIMDLVPNKGTFRQTLRFIKAWGKARAIYSNMFGFPSGIGWAILCAFVCQCYPNMTAAGIVARFFRTYATWFKPNPHELGTENRAIYLTQSVHVKSSLGKGWDPRERKSDARALFPVLTPAVPYGNACYNVTATNLRQLCDEFRRGVDVVSMAMRLSVDEAKERFGPYGVWSKLLEPVEFFGEYKYYLHVEVPCSDPEHYQAYADGVESKMRFLWSGNASSRGKTLEDYKQLRLHLNPTRFEDPVEVKRRQEILETRKKNEAEAQSTRSSTNTARASAGAHAFDRGAAPVFYTAHYFIGMTVDRMVADSQIDPRPAIDTFHNVIRTLRQYREGVTKLPVISVKAMDKIPTFVLEAVDYKPAPPALSAAAATANPADSSAQPTMTTIDTQSEMTDGSRSENPTVHSTTTAATAVSAATQSPSAHGSPSSASSVGAAGHPKTSAGPVKDSVSAASAGAKRPREAEIPVPAAVDPEEEELAQLDQALGLDF